jgi:spore coat protein U-like protein
MKKFLVISAAMMMVLAMVSGAFAAQNTNDVTVTATIAAKCSFSAANSTIAFGEIDPSDTGDKTASTAGLTYACTAGSSAPTITTGLGAQTLTSVTATTDMNYTLSSTTVLAPGAGFGAAGWKPILFTATIAEAQYQAAEAATDYTDTVTVTFSY